MSEEARVEYEVVKAGDDYQVIRIRDETIRTYEGRIDRDWLPAICRLVLEGMDARKLTTESGRWIVAGPFPVPAESEGEGE